MPVFSFVEIRDLIDQSNHKAICLRKGVAPSYPEGMASLIATYHDAENTCSCTTGCTCQALSCQGHWVPKNKNIIFDQSFLDLFRGAYARDHGGVVRPGPRGMDSMSVIFGDVQLQNEINGLFSLSRQLRLCLFCDDYDKVFPYAGAFWDHAKSKNVSPIYISKMLSFLFPDIFIPFDTKSVQRYNQAYKEGKLFEKGNNPVSSKGSYSPAGKGGYFRSHQVLRYYAVTYLMPSNNGLSVKDFRFQSCHSTCQSLCSTTFSKIANQYSLFPPVTRVFDKMFYIP